MDARNIGLRNIEVADTRICSIDGENGKLIYRGFDILDLVNHSTFEETAYLLLFGGLPNAELLADFGRRLREARGLPEPLIRNLRNRPKRAQPMDVVQSCVSELADYDLNIEDASKEAHVRRAISLIAKIPAIVAAWSRIRAGQHVVDEIAEAHAAAVLKLVLLVLRVGLALGLHLHLQVAEALLQVLRRPALQRRPVARETGDDHRPAALHIALDELLARQVLAPLHLGVARVRFP